jgi:type I restriction enzyme M protein
MAEVINAVPRAGEKAVWDALSVTDPEASIVTNRKGQPAPDPDLRDNENVPLPPVPVKWEVDPAKRLASLDYQTAVSEYMSAEVLPFTEDAWVDFDKTKVGYEVPLTRHFFKYKPAKPLAEIDREIKELEAEVQGLLSEVTE